MYRSGTYSRHTLIPDSPNKKLFRTFSPNDLRKSEFSSWIDPEQISVSVNPSNDETNRLQDPNENSKK